MEPEVGILQGKSASLIELLSGNISFLGYHSDIASALFGEPLKRCLHKGSPDPSTFCCITYSH
jgi:hypothetical protein